MFEFSYATPTPSRSSLLFLLSKCFCAKNFCGWKLEPNPVGGSECWNATLAGWLDFRDCLDDCLIKAGASMTVLGYPSVYLEKSVRSNLRPISRVSRSPRSSDDSSSLFLLPVES